MYFTNFLFKTPILKKYQYYIIELKYKFYYALLTFIITFSCCFNKIESILYFLAKHLLLNINSSKFFFSHISNLFWLYIQTSILSAFFIILPFILLNLFIYFIPSLFKSEFKFFLQIFVVFIFIYYINYFLINEFIIPNLIDFFLIFENSNEYFSIHLEAKLEEFFFMTIKLIYMFEFLLLFPVYIYVLILYNPKYLNLLILNKKYFYMCLLIISMCISPPEILFQLCYLIFLIIIFESFIYIYFFFVNYF